MEVKYCQTPLPEVLEIENQCFDHPWTEEDFRCCFNKRKNSGMVIRDNKIIVGYMVYEFAGENIDLLNFAIRPEERRKKYGTRLIAELINKLGRRSRRIVLNVRESNLAAQLFFRSQDFKSTGIVKGFYEATGEDAYTMMYRTKHLKEQVHVPVNRLKSIFNM